MGPTIPYMSMTGKCLRDNAARFNKDKSNLHLITVRDLNKVENIIESEESQWEQRHTEKDVNEEARSCETSNLEWRGWHWIATNPGENYWKNGKPNTQIKEWTKEN